MTAEKPADSEVETFERSVLFECFEGVLGTGRSESAGRLLERRYADLVETYQKDERRDRDLLKKLFH